MKLNMTDYRKALNELDIAYFQRLLPGIDKKVVEMAVRKSAYENLLVPDKTRHLAGEWLRERGLKRIGGLPLLPKGELPK